MRMVPKQDHCYDKCSAKQVQQEENLLTTYIQLVAYLEFVILRCY